jgi:Kef-type K+ transport system membrane component KefB
VFVGDRAGFERGVGCGVASDRTSVVRTVAAALATAAILLSLLAVGATSRAETPSQLADRAVVEAPATVEPDADVAAILDQHPSRSTPHSIAPADRPGAVIKTILGLLTLLGLAYVGGQRWLLEWERRIGISQVVVSGLPFIVLGVIARHPTVGILTDRVLTELSPLLRIGLGCVGFVAGFRFDMRRFRGLPPSAGRVALLSTVLPAALVALSTGPLLLRFSGFSRTEAMDDPVFVRDALLLATAGAMTARSALWTFEGNGGHGTPAQIVRLEELIGIVGLALIASFFRPVHVGGTWAVPGMAWFLLTVGLGTVLGLLFYVLFQEARDDAAFTVVTLGAISFSAGAAGFLHLSSVTVAFVAGVILANFPGSFRARLRRAVQALERPIYLLSLVVIGALWRVDDWRGWLLMPVFAASRLLGKQIAARVAATRRDLPVTAEESRALSISPIGSLAIAIVVSAQLLYPGGSVSLIVSAVMGGSVLTEIFVQLVGRTRSAASEAAP